MKRLQAFSVLDRYSIGFELDEETAVPQLVEKLRAAGVTVERIRLREKAEKAERTVHGREYSADRFLKEFDSLNAMAEDIVYNICCKKGNAAFSVFMKSSTNKVSVLTPDFHFDLGRLIQTV